MASQESRLRRIPASLPSHPLGRADSSSSWRKMGSPSRDHSEPSSCSSSWSSVKTSSMSGLTTNTRGKDGALAASKPGGTRFVEVLSKGRVVALNMEKNFGFLAPIVSAEPKNDFDSEIPKGSDKGVFFRFGHDATLTGGMVLTKGDTMEFLAGTEKEKPRAVFAKLTECNTRSLEELVAYVSSLVDLSEEKAGTVLRIITLCPAGLLLVLAHTKPSSELVRLILQLCENLTKCKEVGLYSSRLNQTYKLFCGSRFLTSGNGVRKFVHIDYEEKESLKEFLLQLLEYVPSQLQIIMPVLSAIVLPEGHSDYAEQYEEFSSKPGGREFLLKVLHVLGGRGADEDISGLAWSELPLLPTRREICTNLKTGSNSGLDVADTVTLPVVRQKGSYESPENYLDTYFRLLREDCFAGLKKGIQSLRAGKLDSRDMKVWSQISVKGIHFERVSPGVTFALGLGNQRSPATTLPMGGSLVCLADDGGHFDSPIWGVVSRCEETSTGEDICFVEIVQSPKSGMGEEIMVSEATLYGRLMKKVDMMMVESPTYYRAYQPVLKALQHMDPLSIPFQEEIVHALWPNEAPAYLGSPYTKLDWSCIFDRETARSGAFGLFNSLLPPVGVIGGSEELDSLLMRGHKTTLDESQLKAVKLALSSRLAIIQGPPGTGKTYIGVKILELLMSANTFPSRPVLVITYKNHALDQFLEKCLIFCEEEGSIVRVGGRCENSNIQKISLQNFVFRRDEFSSDRADNSRKLERIQAEMEKALWRVNSSQLHFGISTVMEYASDLQLRHFLRGTDVHSTPQVDELLSSLPEGRDIAELLHTSCLPGDASSESVAILERLKTLLIKEIKRWIPATVLLKSVQECLSHKKPAKEVLIDRDSETMSTKTFTSQSRKPPCGVTEGEVCDTRQDEKERRSAYETMRQEIKDEDLTKQGTRSDRTWLMQNFFPLPDNEVVDCKKITVEHLKLDASQFDWLLLENPWNLSPEHRAILAHMLWQKSVDDAMQDFASIKSKYDVLVQDMDEISKRRKVAVLQNAKIIGMTTTGAAIQQDVLKFLSPAVILVEEAAEILEPQLLAVLNSDLEHLILIGDHHQLRPSVESFELERRHGFGISMFERLVEHNKLPFQALNLQCRMRKEFVPMLLPIYPGLQSHTELISGTKNLAPACMTQTSCFWSHRFEEMAQRSYVNQGEAQMVVALAQWIVSETEVSKDLTILAAYRGQVTIIRGLLDKFPNMQDVEVCTIDKFQGAENQIVIVSLVRSNLEGQIGHLSIRNRLCVAVSRARSGVYLCGNDTTLSRTSHWRILISFFESQRSLTPSISLCCPRHLQEPAYQLSCLDVTNFSPTEVCQKPCRAELDCGHFCSNSCHAGDHCLCKVEVAFEFDQCGHTRMKFCHEDPEQKLCESKISFTFEDCGHITECECWKSWKTSALTQGRSLKCQFPCGKTLPGCGHACTLLCSDNCDGAPCKACLDIEEEKAKIQRQLLLEAIDRKQKELDVEIDKLKKSGDEGFVVTEVHPNNETAKDFYMAKDRTEKYVQWDHLMIPIVTKVEKIENLELQRKFLEAQKELRSPVEVADWLFYGADDEKMERIVHIGFGIVGKKGCSLEVNSTSIEHLKGSKLLLCEVQLGKTWRVTEDDPKMDLTLLNKRGYDSLSIGAQDGTRVDKHIIYNGAQAIPRFIVHYKLEDRSAIAEMKGFESFGAQEARQANGAVRIPLTPSQNFMGDCPEEYHFRMAESQFFRMSENRSYKITEVEYIFNVTLRERYLNKKAEFTKLADTPPEEKYVFHGTDATAIGHISKEGFKIGGEGIAIKSGDAHGRGVYTALNPDISVAYSGESNMMLLSLALPGILGTDHTLGGGPDVIVLKNVHQLLPKYVVHYYGNRRVR